MSRGALQKAVADPPASSYFRATLATSPLSGSGYLSLSVNTASAALPENPGLISCSRDVSLHKFNKHYHCKHLGESLLTLPFLEQEILSCDFIYFTVVMRDLAF